MAEDKSDPEACYKCGTRQSEQKEFPFKDSLPNNQFFKSKKINEAENLLECVGCQLASLCPYSVTKELGPLKGSLTLLK